MRPLEPRRVPRKSSDRGLVREDPFLRRDVSPLAERIHSSACVKAKNLNL